MKKLTLVTVALFVTALFANAQNDKLSEIGLKFYDLNTFGLQLKSGSENFLFRYSLSLGANSQTDKIDQDKETENNYSFGFGFGFEKRVPMNDDFQFLFGPNVGFSIRYGKSTDDIGDTESLRISPSIGLLLGFNYVVNNKISITAEIIPSLGYYYSKTDYPPTYSFETRETNSFNFSFSNSSAAITVAYRLFK